MAETATKLLDTAQALVVERGFNAFSYKDLASAVGIRTASIHYHYPSKADLGTALMGRYVERLGDALAEIEGSVSEATERLRRFIQVYAASESAGVLCLCGSMASDLETLPEPVQELVEAYLGRSEDWLAQVIASGVQSGEFRLEGEPREVATALLASLQGGLLLARTREASSSLLAGVERVYLGLLGVA